MTIIDTSPRRGPEMNAPQVIGYYAHVREAELTVTDLRDHGFRMRQIGAAFGNAEKQEPDSHRPMCDAPAATPGFGSSTGRSSDREGNGEAPGDRSSNGNVHRWLDRLRRTYYQKPGEHPIVIDPARDSLAADPHNHVQPFSACEGSQEFHFSCPQLASLLTRSGISGVRARHLARRLLEGGALVTVSITVTPSDQADLARRIFARHHGQIYLAESPERVDSRSRSGGNRPDSRSASPASSPVRLFGELLRAYQHMSALGEEAPGKKISGGRKIPAAIPPTGEHSPVKRWSELEEETATDRRRSVQ